MQRRYISKDVDRTWNNYDKEKTKDGKLDWKEYQTAVYGPDGISSYNLHIAKLVFKNLLPCDLTCYIVDASQENAKEYEQMKVRDERRWKLADKTGDSALDKEEYTCFMHPEDCEHMKDIIVTVEL